MTKKFTLAALGTAVALCFTLVFVASLQTTAPAEKAGSEAEEKLRYIEKAMEQEFEKTKSPLTGDVPKEKILEAMAYAQTRLQSGRAIQNINWVERGPTNVGGRTRALIYDLNDLDYSTVYAGGVDGGLWRCLDITAATPVWTRVSDQFDNLAITTIAQQRTNPNIMYFGTGEGWFNVDAVLGLGIWKSTDNGTTWMHLPSTIDGNFQTVQKIVVTDNGDVYAAASPGGLMRSRDGGLTWQRVLGGGSAADVEIAANGDLYASIGIFSPGSLWFSPAGPTAGNAGTWVNRTPANPVTNGMNRIEIATAPSDANYVYILGHDGNSSNCTNIWRSSNKGVSWTPCAVPTNTDQVPTEVNFTRLQAWYDLIAAVDPNDPLTLMIGGVDLHKSINGGSTWIHLTRWYNSLLGAYPYLPTVHADQHAIVYQPGSSNIAIVGNDGGVYRATGLNTVLAEGQVATWQARNDGYNVTQFYAVASHPTNANYFLAGAQDNGSQKFNGPGSGAVATTEASGGDGAFCHIDQDNPNIQITSYVYNNYFISTNGGASFSQKFFANTGSFINPTDYDNAANKLYGGNTAGQYFRWDDPATAGSTTANVAVPQFSGSAVTHVRVSGLTPNRVYFGLANGSVVRVDNAHTGTTATGTVIRTGTGSVSCVEIDPSNENHLVVTYSNYDVQSVWETTDGGATWTSIENNLPNMPVRWALFNPANNDQVFLATEVGVWSTDDLNGTATEWNPTNTNFANVRVEMLQVVGNQIAAATHGRGLFTTVVGSGPATPPAINFETFSKAEMERSTTGFGPVCRGYVDVPVKMYISDAPTGDAVVTLNVITANATATEGKDFDILPANKQLTFASGSNAPQTFHIRIYDDEAQENPDEFVAIEYSISGTTNAIKGSMLQRFELHIRDNDYLRVPHGDTTLVIASGLSNTNLGASSPLQGSVPDKKMQYLYRASELRAMGLKAGSITSLAFIIGTKGTTPVYNGFTMKLGHTSLDQFVSGFVSDAGFTTVYSGNYTTIAGENSFSMATPFVWNGTDNIIFQTCYNNLLGPPASPVGQVPSADDILKGQADPEGKRCQARATSTTGIDDGCALPAPTLLSTFRPILLFGQPVAQTPIQTVLNRSKNAYLGPNEDVYFYDETDGKLLARIQNLTGTDYGCTRVEIDRQAGPAYGSPFVSNIPASYLTTKSFKVLPSANGNSSGAFRITLYYTAAEKTGWESVTGLSWNNTRMVQVKNGFYVPDVSPANPHLNDFVSVAMAPGTVGTNFSAAATFSGHLNAGFAVGTPESQNAPLPAQLLSFKGKLQNNHAQLNWLVDNEDNRGYYVEKSLDGQRFNSIGFVSAQAGSGQVTYQFADPAAAGSVQFYRLSMLGANGSLRYSNVVRLDKYGAAVAVQVYPTLTSGLVNIRYNEPGDDKVVITVHSLSGAMVMNRISTRRDEQLDLSPLAAGTYQVTIGLQRNGERLLTAKIVKQ